MIKSSFIKGYHTGVSLLEMLLSLTVFSVIIFPLIMITTQSVDLSKRNNDTDLLTFEAARMFDIVHQGVNMSYRFLPLKDLKTANPALSLPSEDKAIFFAYWDPVRQADVRVGYWLQELKDGAGNSYTPKRWRLMQLTIPSDASIDSLQTTQNTWQPLTKIHSPAEFYITGSVGDPSFVYCRGTMCGDATVVDPKHADAVRVQSGTATAPSNISISYRNSQVSFRPFYFKLASLQENANRFNADSQVLPLAIAANRWVGKSNSWIGNLPKTIDATNYYVATATAADVANVSSTALRIDGLHYNYLTGELLTAASSNPTGNALYIFRFPPGIADYKPYDIKMATLSTSASKSYTDPFPVTIHKVGTAAYKTDSGWPPDPANLTSPAATPVFLDITQDVDDNIYVLTHAEGTSAFWIQKFSPRGEFISRFSLGSDIGATSVSNNLVYIAYNPAMPNDIMVFLQNSAGNYVIRTYPKEQNDDNPASMLFTSESISLASAGINPTALGSGWADFLWSNVTDMNYDPLHNRFIFVERQPVTMAARILSMDIDLNTNDGTPSSRAIAIPAVFRSDVPFRLLNPRGVAYNPLNNELYISSDYAGVYTYYRVLPNANFGTVRRWTYNQNR